MNTATITTAIPHDHDLADSWRTEALNAAKQVGRLQGELAEVRGHIRHFIYALDKGFLDCKDDSAFIDALRQAVAK